VTLAEEPSYVSRGGLKLAAALSAFDVNVAGAICADFGSHVGGFVDCLIQQGAERVYSVDTAYGTLAWKLRKDPRVVVMERTNALHVRLPEPVDVVVSLIKPHYEAPAGRRRGGVLPDDQCPSTLLEVQQRLAEAGIQLSAIMESPIRGRAGNREFFALIR